MEVSRRSSLVLEMPARKQKPNQFWERQARQRQRSQTVASSVTVVEESPHKPIPQRPQKSAAPIDRRTFYSNIQKKQSRSMKLVEKRLEKRRMEKLEARLTDPKRSCSSLTITKPKRRIHTTVLFSTLMSPSPQKPVLRRTESSSPAKKVDHSFRTPKKSEMGSCSQPASSGVDLSSPCNNTRAQMRLFQSPSPKKPAEMLTKCIVARAKTHKYFICYLFFLLGMISWCLFGAYRFCQASCEYDYELDGIFVVVGKMLQCGPWVIWISLNAALHFLWVGTLLTCQLYQITYLGVTTNERLNFRRYKQFHTSKKGVYRSPYDRGVLQNLMDLMGWRCFGYFRPDQTDWLSTYDIDETRHQPATRSNFSVQRDNYQFV